MSILARPVRRILREEHERWRSSAWLTFCVHNTYYPDMVDRGSFVEPLRTPSNDAQALFQLVGVAEYLARGVEAVCARHGLTSQQFKLLYFLRGMHPGGAARCEMSKRCLRNSPDMTRMIDRLVRRRLVTRSRSPQDRRVSVAKLTPAGVALLDELEPLIEAETRRAMSPLNEAERRELKRLCGSLIA
jgi:DNA-binding MarR family transcriptional regulator